MTILYKYASRSRPDNFFRGVRSIQENSHETSYHILATLDTDDPVMNMTATKELLSGVTNMTVSWGTSENKIHAINRDMDKAPAWDILVCMSDDMVFTAKGYDNVLRSDMTAYFPEGDGVLHYPDGSRKDLITMSIMDRKYYERFNYIYHPSYKSLWCDNEFTEVARMLDRYKFLDKQIFRHLHPAYGLGKFDAQYQHTESFNQEDMMNFKRRKKTNYDIIHPHTNH